jgi:hypothetical protein
MALGLNDTVSILLMSYANDMSYSRLEMGLQDSNSRV